MRDHKGLKDIARNIRKDIVSMIHMSKSGHPGGSLSAVEILTALYFDEMNIDPNNCKMEYRDRFVLSKGHAAPVLYATLAHKGYFDREELKGLRKINRMLQGHPDMTKLNCLDFSSGSLGQGLSVGVGIALANKINNIKTNVYVLLGDGEIQEGQIWEAAMTANKYKLDNLICLIDNNQLQVDGNVNDTNPLTSIADCFTSFGWLSKEVSDGHNFYNIDKTYTTIKNVKNKPKVIIFKTIKGKGVSFMENKKEWHCNTINENDIKNALDELGD